VDIREMEKNLVIVEAKMNNDPQNISIIEEYSSLIDQFNNIG
jgi:hypothetical protein